MELWLDRRAVTLGERITVLVRVTNRGRRTVHREMNTCGTGPAPVTVEAGSGLPDGREWTGRAARLKKELLLLAGGGGRPDTLIDRFTDVEMIDQEAMECAAHSEIGPFAPGDGDEMRVAWDAVPPEGTFFAGGPATITATFWTTDSLGAMDESIDATAKIDVPAQTARGLTIVDHIDTALATPRFASWLDGQPADVEIDALIEFWPNEESEYPPDARYRDATDGAVDVGAFLLGARHDAYGWVTLDTATGAVLGVEFGP